VNEENGRRPRWEVNRVASEAKALRRRIHDRHERPQAAKRAGYRTFTPLLGMSDVVLMFPTSDQVNSMVKANRPRNAAAVS